TAGDVWQYEYDALGNRTASIHNGQRTDYVVDPTGMGDVVAEYVAGGTQATHFTYGIGLVSQVDASNAASYYDFDAVGSTSGLTGGAGTYLNEYSYTPFGEVLTKTEGVANDFQFVGQWGVMAEGHGLSYMRARFYDPTTGRFTSLDP